MKVWAMSYEMVLTRFTKTASVMDLRRDVVEIRRENCRRYEKWRKTNGKRAVFSERDEASKHADD